MYLHPLKLPAVALTIVLQSLAAMAAAAETTTQLEAGFRSPPHEARPSCYWLWLNGYLNREHAARELEALRDAGISGVCIFDMGARGPAGMAPPAGPAFMSEPSAADVAFAVKTAGRLGMDVQLSVASSWDMGGSWVEPRHASMGLLFSELLIEGPAAVDEVLPLPALPAAAPRLADGSPAFCRDVALLAVPADKRLPGHEFIFRLDPPGVHRLDHAVLYNTLSEDKKKYGEQQLFTKDFAIAVSASEPTEASFREVLRASLQPTTEAQRFDLPGVEARYVRLRILSGHNPRFDRVQLAEFQVFNKEGVNVVGSHEADRTRDGADLLGRPSALGFDKTWTADNIHDGVLTGPGGSWSSAGPPPLAIGDPAAIVDLSKRLDASGRLTWNAPSGRWALMRFVCANTGERLKVPSPNSDGLATDHLSAEATRVFLDHLIARLREAMGDTGKTALKQLYLASYEVRGRIWTPGMLDQFRHYRGYDMTPYLPVFVGSMVGDEQTTERFLYDYRKTLGDLLVDAYYRTAVETARAAGLGIESEAGGPGPPIHQVPVDALKALGAIDEVRGEFWPRRPDADRLWVVKETACAAHIYGKRRVHMEAFTSMHHWQDGPFDLKSSADRAFCEGANHMVWHTGAHQPPEAGRPGWVYGAGTHLNVNLVWWPKAKPWLDYLGRCSFLLQQGHFVADVCYYYGDQGYNFVPPKHVDPSLGFGYDYDVVNREVILNRMTSRDGRLVLPDGMSYAILVLPDRRDIDLDVLERLERLVHDGATIVGPKPTRATGLFEHAKRDGQVRAIADRLWGPCDGKTVFEHTVGRGQVVWGRNLSDVLRTRGLGADFQATGPQAETAIDFIHRRTDDADIYFVRNKAAQPISIMAKFRVVGRVPEVWHPDSGRIAPQYDYRTMTDGVAVPLDFDAYGSTCVVFRTPKRALPSLRLSLSDEGKRGAAVEIVNWDGDRVELAAYENGRCRVAADDGRAAEWLVEGLPPPRGLDGPWELRFPERHGAPPQVTLDRLISWTDHPDDGVRYFSGIATYQAAFDVPPDWLAKGRRVLLDLGDLWSVGEVFVNGQPLGVLWKPPYRLDATGLLRPGVNRLTVEVANTWSNRLVGDALLPAEQRITRTNITNSNGTPWKNVPLLRSGLFGPVRLVPAATVSAAVK